MNNDKSHQAEAPHWSENQRFLGCQYLTKDGNWYKAIIIFVALALPIKANANPKPNDLGYKFCNQHKFNFAFLKVYDAYLCTNEQQYLYPEEIFKTNFSLIINYNMDFTKNDLSESSIKEMSRYYPLSNKDQKTYFEQLISIFPDIKKGDIVEAKYSKNGIVNFYHNQLFIGKINDPKFSRIFCDIWLHKDNKYREMTKDLFLKR